MLLALLIGGSCAAGPRSTNRGEPNRVATADDTEAVQAAIPKTGSDGTASLAAAVDSSKSVPSTTVPSPKPPAGDAALDRGAQLYTKYCAICHGEEGDGAGKFAYLMNPRPRNFRQGNFKLATTENQIPSDDDLLQTISDGMPGSAMPPWGHMPRSDLMALVRYVRQFHVDGTEQTLRQWVKEGTLAQSELSSVLAVKTRPGAPLVVPPEPAFDEVRWFRGRRLYLENCASCHGVDGHPVAENVKFDAEGYPTPPRSFVNGIFKGGSTGHQLYVRIWKGMKGTPMPASEGVYSAEEVWDIIHYVQNLARAGAQARAQLRQGTFVAPNVRGELPTGPLDTAWEQARPLYVGLTPLWWIEDRIEGLVVQALHNGQELALRLSWIDPSVDDRAVRHDEFRDAVAIQFSMSSDPPFYMGDTTEHGGVNIWMWKADRQKNIAAGYQDVDAPFPHRAVDVYPEQEFRLVDMSVVDWPHEVITKHDPVYVTAWGAGNLVADPKLETPVECLVARGPGTLAGKPANVQFVAGAAAYDRGVWFVQLQRTMALPHAGGHEYGNGDEREFKPGDYLPVSFAVWNGSAGDRDGKKNISIWQKLVIE
jgi:DMSO reductase family type II enzyme heme b subunit